MALSSDAIAAVKNKIQSAESGGNPNAQNPMSSASGLFQYTNGTWLNTVKQNPNVFGDLSSSSDAAILAVKNNPDLQNKAMDISMASYANTLNRNGIDITPGSLYASHFLGPQGAVNLFQQDKNTPVDQFLPANVLNANPNLKNPDGSFITAGQLESQLDKKAGGDGTLSGALDPKTLNGAASGLGAQQPPAAGGGGGAGCAAGGLMGIAGIAAGGLLGGFGLGGVLSNAMNAIGAGGITGALSSISGSLSGALSSITGSLGGALSGLTGGLTSTLGSALGNIGSSIGLNNLISGTLQSAITSGVSGLISGQGLSGFMNGAISGFTGGLGNSLGSVLNQVTGGITSSLNSVIGSIGSNILPSLSGVLPGSISNIVGGALGGAVGNITAPLTGILQNPLNLPNAAQQFASFGGLPGVINQITQNIAGNQTPQGVQTFVNTMMAASGVASQANQIVGGLSEGMAQKFGNGPGGIGVNFRNTNDVISYGVTSISRNIPSTANEFASLGTMSTTNLLRLQAPGHVAAQIINKGLGQSTGLISKLVQNKVPVAGVDNPVHDKIVQKIMNSITDQTAVNSVCTAFNIQKDLHHLGQLTDIKHMMPNVSKDGNYSDFGQLGEHMISVGITEAPDFVTIGNTLGQVDAGIDLNHYSQLETPMHLPSAQALMQYYGFGGGTVGEITMADLIGTAAGYIHNDTLPKIKDLNDYLMTLPEGKELMRRVKLLENLLAGAYTIPGEILDNQGNNSGGGGN